MARISRNPFTDLYSSTSFGGGGDGGGGGGTAAVTKKMNSDNSASKYSDVSEWFDEQVKIHAASKAGYSGDNDGGTVGACSSCHQGAYDPLGGSNSTYKGQGR